MGQTVKLGTKAQYNIEIHWKKIFCRKNSEPFFMDTNFCLTMNMNEAKFNIPNNKYIILMKFITVFSGYIAIKKDTFLSLSKQMWSWRYMRESSSR